MTASVAVKVSSRGAKRTDEEFVEALRRLARLVRTHEAELFVLAYEYECSEVWLVSSPSFDVCLAVLIGKTLARRYRTGFRRLVELHGIEKVRKVGYHALLDATTQERAPRGATRFSVARSALLRIAHANDKASRADLVAIAKRALSEIDQLVKPAATERAI